MNVRNDIDTLAQIFPSSATSTAASKKSDSNSPLDPLAGDKAQVSSVAAQIALSSTSSDVRLDKVASIQASLQSGTYSVPAADVAQKVLTSLLDTQK
jgi:negative regulator of flagellin synthesis FlgM